MDRIPETELMNEREQAEAYSVADFDEVNRAFVVEFTDRFPDLTSGRILDLGCGPADIPIRFCGALPDVQITALDGAAAMLLLGKDAVSAAGLSDRIQLIEAMLPHTWEEGAKFDAVVSNSLLHHLPDPRVLWSEVCRTAKRGAPVLVMDLMRPDSQEAAKRIVDMYAAHERPILRHDFYNSLLAAFNLEEIRAQLAEYEILQNLRVEAIDDRHVLVSGRTKTR